MCAIVITVALLTFIGIIAIRSIGYSDSDRMLYLQCESGEKNINSYFIGVENSVEMVSAYVELDLEGRSRDELADHIEHAKTIFAKMAEITDGVLTYYYRIDSAVSNNKSEDGFWFIRSEEKTFSEHEPTDISLYDTTDTTKLVWFTVPKVEGIPVWLPPYITDNLNVRVISYNVPIYWNGDFLGVVGIEIDYETLAGQVDDISLYDNGYAFIVDNNGTIIYHPYIDVNSMETQPKISDDLLVGETFISYTYKDIEKRATWQSLSNGMRLYITAPVSEINAGWMKWIYRTIAVSAAFLVGFGFMLILLIRMIHKRKEAENKNLDLEKELRSAAELTELMGSMSSLLTNMPAMSFSKDAETGVYLACNKAFAAYAGKSDSKEIIGLTDYDLFSKEEAKRFIENDKTAMAMDEAFVYFEDAWDAGCSAMRSLQTTKKKFRDATGKLCILGMCVDVTEAARAKAEEAAAKARQQKDREKQALEARYKEHVEKLSYKVNHDELTGVYNRAGFDLILSEIDLSYTYMLMVDADGFKSINDSYGHEIGDRILMKIATSLKNNFRAEDCICRIGGDEFVVIMLNAEKDRRDFVTSKIERINLDLANTDDGLPVISVSVGIAHGSEVEDPAALLELADKAMYEAKRSGKHGYRFSETK